MRVVNVSERPFEPVFDSCYYPAILPGAVADFPDDVARFIIRKSAIVDDLGDVIGYRIEPLDAVLGNADMRAGIALYQCPLSLTRECQAANFKTLDELTTHLETHKTPKADLRYRTANSRQTRCNSRSR